MQKDVLVVGSYNLDLVFEVTRLPRPGETLLSTGRRQAHGGKGSNQAVQAARCGARTALIAAVGGDPAGDAAASFWRREGVDALDVVRPLGADTGQALILVDADGENAIIVASGANLRLTPGDIDARARVVASARILAAQMETPPAATLRAFQIARSAGSTTLLNAAPAPEAVDAELLASSDILIVNEGEGLALTGSSDPDEAGRRLLARVGRAVLVTLGSKGVRLYERGEPPWTLAAHKVEVVDTTGAGDAFIGAFAARLAQTGDLKAAAQWGAAAGALACQTWGAAPSFASAARIRALAGGD